MDLCLFFNQINYVTTVCVLGRNLYYSATLIWTILYLVSVEELVSVSVCLGRAKKKKKKHTVVSNPCYRYKEQNTYIYVVSAQLSGLEFVL